MHNKKQRNNRCFFHDFNEVFQMHAIWKRVLYTFFSTSFFDTKNSQLTYKRKKGLDVLGAGFAPFLIKIKFRIFVF